MLITYDEDKSFIEVANWDWNASLVECARDKAAVQRYFEAIDSGFLGQAIRERYAFDGQISLGGIVDDTGLPIDELVISDLQELLDDDDDRLPATQALLTQGLANTNDPGIEPVRTMVSMMEANPPAARRKRALRARVQAFLDEEGLDLDKTDRLLDILLD
jgi:hypothetical protein